MRSLAYARKVLITIALAALLSVIQGCAQETPHPPSLHPFEAVLDGDDLAKFDGLPSEFQDALREESEVTSIGTAMRYLRELPDEVKPMADILPAEALSKFRELGPRFRRAVLLGYDEAFKDRLWQDPAGMPPPADILAGLVRAAHEAEFGEPEVHLPPITDALSQEALDKLDSVAPSMRRAFELVWDNRKALPEDVDGVVSRLEESLLAAPDAPPNIADIGLSAHSMELLDEISTAERFVEEWLAAEVVLDADWRSNTASSIDRFLGQFRTPEDRADLARLYLPARSGAWPVVCHFGPSFGVWLEWALPSVFHDVPPNHLIAGWPSHRETLSPEALARLDSLDSQLQEAFRRYWYGAGPLPMEARLMACLALMWNIKLEHIAFTAVPPLASIVSEEALAEYESLSKSGRHIITQNLALVILEGDLIGAPKTVYLHTLSTEEALEALGAWAEGEIRNRSGRRDGD